MKRYIIYDANGTIIRTGVCNETSFKSQTLAGEQILEGRANDVTQKIIHKHHFGTFPLVVDKSPEELTRAKLWKNRKHRPKEKCRAHITNEQFQAILDRLDNVELKLGKL